MDLTVPKSDIGSHMDAALESFFLVGIAEVFDKTWFVALLMSMKHGRLKLTVFVACFAGLLLHVIIAAGFGFAVSSRASLSYLHFAAAALYAFFAALYLKDWYTCEDDADILSAGKEEAEEALAEENPPSGKLDYDSAVGLTAKFAVAQAYQWRVFVQAFSTMFIAEWGDRTQIAMIGQHASQPLIPVCVGSAFAFFLLTLSAVVAGSLLSGTKLQESTVHLIGAVSFAIFSLLALMDGLRMTGGETPKWF